MWVLVVDDDPEIRRVVRRGLEQHDCQVAEAADGPTALAMLGELDVDVAILDRQLPGMSGLELLREVRRLTPSTHIIMLTGAAAEADRVLGLVSGADDYMVKPFSVRELAARVSSARRRQRTADQAVAEESVSDTGPTDAAPQEQASVVLQGTTIVCANPAALALVGAETADQLVGREVFSFIGVDSVPAVRQRYEAAEHEAWSAPELISLNRLDGLRQRVLISSQPEIWEGSPASQVSLWVQSESQNPSQSRILRPGDGGKSASAADEVLVEEIRRGITAREFIVFYQPIVRLVDGVVVGAEALVRWQHPERGLLFPGDFIDVAEESGAIVDLGAFVLEEACAQWVIWRDAGRPVYVSVNLSALQLADPNLPDMIARLSMPEGQLWLEVTETSLIRDLAQAGEILTRVTNLGPKVSIDDFGTGWASMTYLREFPVHALKIDRSFVHGVGTSAVDTAIASSVVALGGQLALKVVAEGIETPDQFERLRELGCEYGQGYLFGRPVAADDLDLVLP